MIFFVTSNSTGLPGADIDLPLVESGILLLEDVEEGLTGLQNFHECLLSLLNSAVELLLRFVLLDQGVCQDLKPLGQRGDLSLNGALFFFIFGDLIMKVIPALSDVLDVPGELRVVPLQGAALRKLYQLHRM